MTRIFVLVVLLELLLPCSGQSPPVDLSLEWMYYTMDSISSDNKMTDSSPNHRDGDVIGSPTVEPGIVNNCLNFHNEVQADKVINAGTIGIGGTFSMTAWVKASVPDADKFMKVCSSKTYWNEPAGWEFQYNPSQGVITFLSSGSNTGTASANLGSSWHHVAAVVSGTSVILYVDGVDRTGDGDIDAAVVNAGKELLVGASSLTPNAGGSWIGSIDEFRIHTIALSQKQVLALMYYRPTPTPTTPAPSQSPSTTTSPSPSTSDSPIPSPSPLPSNSTSSGDYNITSGITGSTTVQSTTGRKPTTPSSTTGRKPTTPSSTASHSSTTKGASTATNTPSLTGESHLSATTSVTTPSPSPSFYDSLNAILVVTILTLCVIGLYLN